MPSDHVIHPVQQFLAAVDRAVDMISRQPGSIALFGVPPSYPATGYGYIERGATVGEPGAGSFRVASFKEKPSEEAARQYLASGSCYWNCGIFVWRAATILAALARYVPKMHAALMRLAPSIRRGEWERALAEEFPRFESISIDFAVLERAEEVYVLEAPFEWDDVGSWQALPRLLGHDPAGNTADGPFCGHETRDSIIRSSSDHLIATMGVADLVIVHTPTATLVARKQDEDGLRELVRKLEREGYGKFL
jgi:mannose-1-phosphate guanylyltransferase